MNTRSMLLNHLKDFLKLWIASTAEAQDRRPGPLHAEKVPRVILTPAKIANPQFTPSSTIC